MPRNNRAGTTTTLNTLNTYDIAGNITRIVDPRGVRIDFDYATNDTRHTYAMANIITHYPVLGSTGTTLSEQFGNDWDLAKPISHMDLNGNVTNYSYPTVGTDTFDRLGKITLPDGGSTVFLYGDTPGSMKVTASQDRDTAGDSIIQNIVLYDGLGRKKTTQHLEGGGTSFFIGTDFRYDNRGRLSSVSNPYRGSATDFTVTSYDGLNRVISATQPGGAVTQTKYHANQNIVIDPILVNRLNTTDALGRLSSVVENATSWQGRAWVFRLSPLTRPAITMACWTF